LEIWKPLIELSEDIRKLFDANFTTLRINEELNFEGWRDNFWESDQVRKCHLKTIDNRQTQKLWLMHINIFPKVNLSAPILGFDIVAGPSKITGTFFDFSPVGDNHSYMKYFKEQTSNLEWSKPRELPDWAKQIFSENMIAAGNLRTEEEINQLCKVCLNLTTYYVNNLDKLQPTTDDYKEKHNFYCSQQKLNPHLHRSILAMGISEEDKNNYVNEILFEEI
jgi:hypothetical protein